MCLRDRPVPVPEPGAARVRHWRCAPDWRRLARAARPLRLRGRYPGRRCRPAVWHGVRQRVLRHLPPCSNRQHPFSPRLPPHREQRVRRRLAPRQDPSVFRLEPAPRPRAWRLCSQRLQAAYRLRHPCRRPWVLRPCPGWLLCLVLRVSGIFRLPAAPAAIPPSLACLYPSCRHWQWSVPSWAPG